MQAASGGASPSKMSPALEPPPRLEAASSIAVKKDGEESDADVRKVPDMSAGLSTSSGPAKSQGGSSSRRRGAAPAEKETKRIKRLLRNRVSAQQARERKKAYVLELETRTKELEQKNAELEETVSTLQHENHMLRQIVRNTTMKKQ